MAQLFGSGLYRDCQLVFIGRIRLAAPGIVTNGRDCQPDLQHRRIHIRIDTAFIAWKSGFWLSRRLTGN